MRIAHFVAIIIMAACTNQGSPPDEKRDTGGGAGGVGGAGGTGGSQINWRRLVVNTEAGDFNTGDLPLVEVFYGTENPVQVMLSASEGQRVWGAHLRLSAEAFLTGEVDASLGEDLPVRSNFGKAGGIIGDPPTWGTGVAHLRFTPGAIEGTLTGDRADIRGTFSGSMELHCWLPAELLGRGSPDTPGLMLEDEAFETEYCRPFGHLAMPK